MKKILVIMLMLILTTVLTAATGPILNVDKAQQQPILAQPGQTVEVWVSIQNTASDSAKDLVIEAEDSYPFTLINERNRETTISVLGGYQERVIRYELLVDSDAPEGINNFVVKYQTGYRSTVTKNIPVEVRTSEAIATIGNVVLEPPEVTPGDEAKLTVSVRNIGGSNLRDFTIGLNLDKEVGPQDMIINDPPFYPAGSGTEKSINRIRPGQTTEFTFDLEAYPNAETNIYKIPVYMSYFDDSGNKYEKEDLIALKVNSDYGLDVRVDSSDLTKQNPSGDVTFIVVNHGLSDLKLMNIELNENDDFSIRSSSNRAYLGSLDSDDFDTIRFRINALAEEVEFPVTLTFRDSMNNEFTEEFVVTHRLPEGQAGGNATLIIVVLIIAGAGFWYYRKKKKQRLLKQDD